ncbi:hypothetical protein [Streptosporangium longisporum]|uniref:Guanylate cyclase domain-containing protein n=1 Tax=Streptosporangium longisporum TaxID=46187 RepID=A0ABP6KHE8_9ACTN
MDAHRRPDGIPRDRTLINRALDGQLPFPQRSFGNRDNLAGVVMRLLDEHENFVRLAPCRLSGSTPGSAVIVLSDRRTRLADLDAGYRHSGTVTVGHGELRDVVVHNDRRLGILDTADVELVTASSTILARGLLRRQAEAVRSDLEFLSGRHGRERRSETRDREDPGRELVRTGFAVDIVGYSGRPASQRKDLQERLEAIFIRTMGELDVDIAATDRQGTGDGMNVFLPQALELHTALPRLLHAWRDHLARDNRRHADRMRLRMAVALGPVGITVLGYSGPTVIEVNRMLDSAPLRRAVREHPRADLAVLVSDLLHRYTVGEGHPGLDPFEFTSCDVANKGFTAGAWLWIAK